jgi:hypothetical protein
LSAWWEVAHAVTTPRVLGPYAVAWETTEFRDAVLGRLGGVFRGTVMQYQADRGFFVADVFWLPPDGADLYLSTLAPLNGALAKYLRTAAPNWDAKLQRLLGLMKELPPEGPGRALLLNGIDMLVAEMLSVAATLSGLLGPNPDLGRALMNLTELFLGGDVQVAEGDQSIHELARFFAKDELPVARQAIATRIIVTGYSTAA